MPDAGNSLVSVSISDLKQVLEQNVELKQGLADVKLQMGTIESKLDRLVSDLLDDKDSKAKMPNKFRREVRTAAGQACAEGGQPEAHEPQVPDSELAMSEVPFEGGAIRTAMKSKSELLETFFGDLVFDRGAEVLPVGSAEPGDPAHLRLGVSFYAALGALLYFGAFHRVQPATPPDVQGMIIPCTARADGDELVLPEWISKAFPTANSTAEEDRKKCLVGYEVCNIIRDYHKDQGQQWERVSTLEVLHGKSCPGIGPATHFFSHSQAETVTQTLGGMHLTMVGTCWNFDQRLFLDYLSIRQCAKGDFKPSAVQQIIGNIGRTSLFLAPVVDPIVLKRAWCVYELSCTIRVGAKLVVIPEGKDPRSLLNILESIDCLNVQLQDCEARDKADKDMIMEHIASGQGLATTNMLVAETVTAALNAWKENARMAVDQ